MKEEERKNKKRSIIIVALLLLFLLTIGYAALTAQLKVTGTTTIKGNSWNVHLANVHGVQSQGATVTTAPTINAAGNTVNFNVSLKEPGDYYEFQVDAVNTGGIDAKLSAAPTVSGLTTAQQKYATFSVTYGGTAAGSVAAGDTLPSTGTGSTKTIVVRVSYKADIANTDLPEDDVTLSNLSVTFNYVQA